TYLLPEQITRLIRSIRKHFKISNSAEMSCEIDPRELKREHLVALREGGFNRISMGVQDFNETVQNAVNRLQPEALTRQVAQWVRELNYHSLNLDLIYGLPFQTVESFCHTIESIIDIAPDRIALFNYAHVPWMKKHMSLIQEKDLPAPEEKLEIFKMSIEKLTSAGYVFIGMDHFARPDNELAIALTEKKLGRNFQGYTTHAGLDLYGLGITSISQLSRVYAQNVKTEKEYYQILDQQLLPTIKGYTLTNDDLLRREVIMRLMCHFELDFASIENHYEIDFEKYFADPLSSLESMVQDELLQIKNRFIKVTEKGRLLIRNIAMNFDAYLEKKSDQKSVYSKTV
ncbi:MAG: oxygen-independent coproporphyrinogen III oxidase, partial [Planctomycetota bacterium]